MLISPVTCKNMKFNPKHTRKIRRRLEDEMSPEKIQES